MESASATIEVSVAAERRAPSEASTVPNAPALVEPVSLKEEGVDSATRVRGVAAICPVERLDSLGPKGRLKAYRSGALSRRERTIWACRYPEEVPILNGEVEWIALRMADFD